MVFLFTALRNTRTPTFFIERSVYLSKKVKTPRN